MNLKLLKDQTVVLEAKLQGKSQEMLKKYPRVITQHEDIELLLRETETDMASHEETIEDSLDRLKVFQLAHYMHSLIKLSRQDISLHREP